MAWYSGVAVGALRLHEPHALGPYAWAYWTMVSCNVLFPQLLWFKQDPPHRHC